MPAGSAPLAGVIEPVHELTVSVNVCPAEPAPLAAEIDSW
jgi:hypothetical protein